MVKLAVPQVRGWFGVGFFRPQLVGAMVPGCAEDLQSFSLLPEVVWRGSPCPRCLERGFAVGGRLICTGTWRRNASGVLDPSTSGWGRGAAHLFPACALRRVAVVENFPRVFLEGQLGATHQTAGEQLPELIICPQPP